MVGPLGVIVLEERENCLSVGLKVTVYLQGCLSCKRCRRLVYRGIVTLFGNFIKKVEGVFASIEFQTNNLVLLSKNI